MEKRISRYLEEVDKQLLVAFHMLGRGHSYPVDHRVNSLLVKLVQLQVEERRKKKQTQKIKSGEKLQLRYLVGGGLEHVSD